MNIRKKMLQALAGMLLAALVCVTVGTWAFPEENDLIASYSGFRVSVAGIGAGVSLLILLAFADGWIRVKKSETANGYAPGRMLNSLGFGLLPAVCVWKVFEAGTLRGPGMPVVQGFQDLIPANGLMTAEGLWLPGRFEAALALVLFASEILWLTLRKNPLPENGDMSGISVCLWSTGRAVTESFRANQIRLPGERPVGWIALAAGTIVFVCWMIRLFRQRGGRSYVLACVPVYLISVTGLALIRNGMLLQENDPAGLILQIALALLAMKATLCAGRVSRNAQG